MATKAQDYQAKQKKFRPVAHQFVKKVFHWRYCSGCGLVNLKNDSTRKRMAEGCQSMED